MLRGGTERVHADARRLRLLALLVFFLGTAMAGYSCVCDWCGAGVRERALGGATGRGYRLAPPGGNPRTPASGA
jgi:hypothetical protein